MKKALFILMMLLLLGIVFSYAQCGKKQVITASKTEYLDASGNVQRTVDESTTIEYNDSLIVITTGAEGQEMRGPVKSITCGWKTAYKEGKTVIKAPIVDPRGDVKNLTITIEGNSVMVNGNQIIAVNIPATNGTIHVINGVLMPQE